MRRGRFISAVSSFTFLFISFTEVSAERAESTEAAARPAACGVEVRVIKGAQRRGQYRFKRLETGNFLTDVKSQLQPLPYGSYKVLEAVEKEVRLGEQVDFQLTGATGDSQRLGVRPEKLLGKRVQTQINWEDAAGGPLLSTKLRMTNGETMVLGTENDAQSSTIVCIKVACKTE